MENIKWNKLPKIADWAKVLSDLLGEAKSAVANNDSDKRLEIQRLLVRYTEKSPLKCAALSKIASEAAEDLFLNQVDESLKAMAFRNADLEKLMELVNNVTGEARKDEKELQFENLIETLETIKGIAETLKDVEGTLTDQEADVLAKIEAVTKAVEEYEKNANTD